MVDLLRQAELLSPPPPLPEPSAALGDASRGGRLGNASHWLAGVGRRLAARGGEVPRSMRFSSTIADGRQLAVPVRRPPRIALVQDELAALPRAVVERPLPESIEDRDREPLTHAGSVRLFLRLKLLPALGEVVGSDGHMLDVGYRPAMRRERCRSARDEVLGGCGMGCSGYSAWGPRTGCPGPERLDSRSRDVTRGECDWCVESVHSHCWRSLRASGVFMATHLPSATFCCAVLRTVPT